jgi:hypothetical protein
MNTRPGRIVPAARARFPGASRRDRCASSRGNAGRRAITVGRFGSAPGDTSTLRVPGRAIGQRHHPRRRRPPRGADRARYCCNFQPKGPSIISETAYALRRLAMFSS